MIITVLGGGNGSFAAAADLTLAGHEVRLWRRDEEQVSAHRAAGGTIKLIEGRKEAVATLHTITSSIAEALAGAELVLCPLPAFAQDSIAQLAAPHLEDGQVVFLPPGTFGSYVFAKAVKDAGGSTDVAFAETGTLPWLARKKSAYEVRLSGRGVRLPTGVFPQSKSAHALEVIGRAFPGAIEDCGDALSAALMNAGPIIHPPLIVMNAAAIEHFDTWDIHTEGTQPAVRRVTDALDRERIVVREAFGYGAPHFPLANHYNKTGEMWMYGREDHDTISETRDWNESLDLATHRYMLEDTRMGLSLLSSFGALAEVATPLVNGFMAIGGAIVGEDFMKTGRSRSALGLDHLDRDQLRNLLVEGFK
ncbi:NAD/NADP-dependent octopine/nopaline dehydrogenase family protein [Martelella soudanensis]|uniref:NAD/NADP-dependent octopine/nopaline dehydrogenase family protein n=1 Tax=unclassified Martelella TaxID=2629616 RepID=UPI0015DE5964|nr:MULTISPECIES: NAD/NADP-dependent octopine/nopaline dehydrogenase family protein [unclassified Martelella]